MTLFVKIFMQRFHIRIWQMTAIMAHEDDQSTRIFVRKVLANAMAVIVVIYWILILCDLVFSDIDDKIYPSIVFLVVIFCSVKYCLFRYQRDRLGEMVKLVLKIENLTVQTDASEQELLRSGVNSMNWIANTNICACWFGTIILILKSLFSAERALIVPIKLPIWIDWKNQYWVYALCMLLEIMITSYLVILTTTLDFFGPHMFILLNSYLAILDKRIRAIGWNSDSIKLDVFQCELMRCFQFHNLCLRLLFVAYNILHYIHFYFRLSKLVNSLFALQFLILFGINTIGLCIVIYITSTVSLMKYIII